MQCVTKPLGVATSRTTAQLMTRPVSIVHDWLVFQPLSTCSSQLHAAVDGLERRGPSRARASTQALFLS